jgi:uncharacterized membrane protein
MFLIDALWIGVVAKSFYAKYLGPLMTANFFWPAVVVFYLLYAAGLVYFAVLPGLRSQSWAVVFGNGAFLGFIAYMTYDLTNWGTLKNWAWQIVPVDILWGTVLSGGVAVIAYFIALAIGY